MEGCFLKLVISNILHSSNFHQHLRQHTFAPCSFRLMCVHEITVTEKMRISENGNFSQLGVKSQIGPPPSQARFICVGVFFFQAFFNSIFAAT